jgi:uncharacterized protein (TIGR03437 family)
MHRNFNHNDSPAVVVQCTAAWFLLLSLAGGVGIAQPPKTLAVVNAAGGATEVASASIASAFGRGIGASTESAHSLPLPTTLSGVSLEVTDSANVSQMAQLIYVSPNQINFVLPDGVASGMATVKIMNGASTPPSTTVNVATVAPGLFTANASGTGVAAAIAIRRVIATQTETMIPVYHCDANGCTSVPIDLESGTEVFLELFGTGIRGRSSLANVSATIGNVDAKVLFAGAQGQFPGLDQVNLSLPLSLRRKGETNLVLTVDGTVANTVRVNLQ